MGTDIHAVFQAKKGNHWVDVPSGYQEGRHYLLFAVLAGVRNGYGFAGYLLGDPVVPIAEPRGFPEGFELVAEAGEYRADMHPVESLELMGWRREWHDEGEPLAIWMGDHSFSWLSGAEMLEWYAKADQTRSCGYVDRAFYESWDGVTPPNEYSFGIMGPGIITVDDIADAEARPGWTHIRIWWNTPLREALAYFFDEVARLQAEYGEIRMVFGFDS